LLLASVFLSYDRDDADQARHFARALEKAGHEVWWDLHVRGGAQFSKVIEEALKAADAVVVLWSVNSIESAWVRDEAAAGRDSGRLVPVTIDGTEPPLGFRQFQTVNLSRWKGRARPPQLETFLADVDAVAESSKGPVPPSKKAATARPRLPSVDRRAVVAVFAAIGLVAALLWWRPWTSNTAVPAVLVTSAQNDSVSQGTTRDLAIQLASQPTLQSGALRLITSGSPASDKPTLTLEVSKLAEPQSRGASLLLKTNTSDAVIWSHDFEQGQRSPADMNLQMALTAARVLGCAADALGKGGRHLATQSRNLYLATCGQTAEGGNYDPQPVVDELSKVVTAAPAFAPAWRELLLAEADAIDLNDEPEPRPAAASTLRGHIAAALRVEPNMAEAKLAQISLVPTYQLVTRMRLIDEVYRSDPDNPAVLIRRSRLLQDVGRMSEGVRNAYGASGTDQTSAAALDNYITTLSYAGQIDLAAQQLKRAQLLWPGTKTLDDLEFRYNLRFGDPKIALQMAGNRMMGPTLLMFLQARADPSKENIDKLFALYAARVLGDPATRPSLHILMQAYGQFHRENELYEIMLHWPNQAEFATMEEVWFRPALHQFRRDPRFMQAAARSPLLSYWRTTGHWPDFCKEPDLPYDCRKEAAKYPI
jgi:hypothetical protein